jgi:hypothetical protein
MPHKEFLEQYPLYRKFLTNDIPASTDMIPKVSIKMNCPTCKSDQTFIMTNEYYENFGHVNHSTKGIEFRLEYVCMHCKQYNRYFYVKVDEHKKYLMKIGQYPSWEIFTEPNIERLLGEHSGYFKRGLICESQGYGIGAFAYYRRIIEEIIDQLLDEIAELLSGDEKDIFVKALEETKSTIVAKDKIALVKDLLPAILRPEGMNPLSTLHSLLSEGLHSKSDEDCIQSAMSVREVLVFLVNQVSASKEASKNFTTNMRKLLEKKSKKATTS